MARAHRRSAIDQRDEIAARWANEVVDLIDAHSRSGGRRLAVDIIGLDAIRAVPIEDHVFDYVLALTRGTRVRSDAPLPFLVEWVSWGAGPRASQFLVLGGKARALLQGRFYVSAEDIRAVARPVFRHRLRPHQFL